MRELVIIRALQQNKEQAAFFLSQLARLKEEERDLREMLDQVKSDEYNKEAKN